MLATLAATLVLAATPAAPDPAAVVATLKGKPIHRRDAADGRALLGRILAPLLEEFAVERRVDATPAEVTEQIRRIDETKNTMELSFRRELAKLEAALANAQNDYQTKVITETIESLKKSNAEIRRLQPQLEKYRLPEAERRETSRTMIRGYKINQALWGEYGGRVIFQQFGPEPIDAYRRFLEDHQKKGTFTIVDKTMKDAFWEYLVTDRHTVIDGPEAKQMMTTPWWSGPVPDE